MENLIENVAETICSVVWGLPLITMLVCVGIYFSFKLDFLQIRRLGEAFKYVIASNKKRSHKNVQSSAKSGVQSNASTTLIGDISSFASLCTALSATLGTGNIVGIAVALSIGGPGTLFWMIVSSFFSLSTKYCEGFLAVKYRKIGSDGKIAGGPMYYIEKSFKNRRLAKFLATCFAIFGAGVALIGIGTLAQTNSIAAAVSSFGIPISTISISLGVIVALVTFGGIHRIGDVAEKIVPFMTILYLGAAVILLAMHANAIFSAIKLICSDAFSPRSIVGGTLGSAIVHSLQIGLSRGIFCHESGLGSAAIASAAAKTKSPDEQGLICMVGAFLSIIVCSITGLVLVTTNVLDAPHAIPETLLTAQAFENGLGIAHFGTCIVNISIVFFAFTTIIGWNYYGEKCVQYVLGTRAIMLYRALFLLFVFVGPFLQIKTAFIIADIVIGLMAIPNVISLIMLRKEIYKN